jgi:hypothetical protein
MKRMKRPNTGVVNGSGEMKNGETAIGEMKSGEKKTGFDLVYGRELPPNSPSHKTPTGQDNIHAESSENEYSISVRIVVEIYPIIPPISAPCSAHQEVRYGTDKEGRAATVIDCPITVTIHSPVLHPVSGR